MKKSLFRLTDMLELSIAYIFCFFLNLLFDHIKTIDLDSYILKVFLKNIIAYQSLIVLLFTCIVIVFHYQMLHRKNAEIIGMILLLCMADYISFIAARSILSTFQGYQETKYIDQKGGYIANLDPDSHIDMDAIDEDGTQAVYDYLNNNFNYAFYTDGFIVSVPNIDDVEISLGYMTDGISGYGEQKKNCNLAF